MTLDARHACTAIHARMSVRAVLLQTRAWRHLSSLSGSSGGDYWRNVAEGMTEMVKCRQRENEVLRDTLKRREDPQTFFAFDPWADNGGFGPQLIAGMTED